MIQLQIGSLVVKLEGQNDKERLEDLVRTDAVKHFADILLNDILPVHKESALDALRTGDVDEARREASYAEAIEDVANALKSGISEALKEA